MENPRTAAVERLKEADNVLVTVSNNPSVDQLAAAIGLTLLLNKLGKHATAVFSGDIPSTIEFLQPEQTLEKNTDSLRDFIISLDKSKADKLRYKVEEKLVRIFITPYHTSLSHDDLEFSLGDFNVDAVVALGVHEQQDLDRAIVAHGRILHDATIIAVNTNPNGSLGTISWVNEHASSLSEMVADLGLALKNDVLDGQMATAMLTGIVAETNRFSNQKTTSETMSLSAKLMAAGANQQLVATKLQESADNMLPETQPDNMPAGNDASAATNPDGSLVIEHSATGNGEPNQPPTPPKADEPDNDWDHGGSEPQSVLPDTPKPMTEPPSRGGTLTASGQTYDDLASSMNPLSLPPVDTPLLSHNSNKKEKAGNEDEQPKKEPRKERKSRARKTVKPIKEEAPKEPEPPQQTAAPKKDESAELPEPVQEPELTKPKDEPVEMPASDAQPTESTEDQLPDKPAQEASQAEPIQKSEESDSKTLDEIERSVDSPHLKQQEETPEDLDLARDLNIEEESSPSTGAQPVNLDLGHDMPPSAQVIPTAAVQDRVQSEQYLDVNKIDEETGETVDPNKQDTEQQPSAVPPVNLPPPPLVPPPLMTNPPTMTFGEQPLPNQEDDNNPTQPAAPL